MASTVKHLAKCHTDVSLVMTVRFNDRIANGPELILQTKNGYLQPVIQVTKNEKDNFIPIPPIPPPPSPTPPSTSGHQRRDSAPFLLCHPQPLFPLPPHPHLTSYLLSPLQPHPLVAHGAPNIGDLRIEKRQHARRHS